MPQRAVKSTIRTFEVLELFAERRRPMQLNEIYGALGYPQSSTTGLLKSMVMCGYLNYNRELRTYLPTTRVSMLGNWLPGFFQAAGGFRELVEELQVRTDETVALITRNDLFIQYIILLTPNHEHQMAPPVGAMRKLVDSSAGLCLMARMDDKSIDKLCRYSNAYRTGDSVRVS
ncbi:MAG: helix-turn-helix domain-containing protein, partial [Caulobacterales bacterium]